MQNTLNLQHKSPERWKWIPGFEGLYQASTWGRIRSVDRWVIDTKGRKQFRKGRILRPKRDRWGYLFVGLYRNGKPRNFKIHRLVAETWLDNPENKPEVNHLDENKENCAVENLSYCDHKANINWGTRNKRVADSLSKSVQALDPSTGQVVKEFPSMKEAERNGFNHRNISACCRGLKWRRTHKGLIWRYDTPAGKPTNSFVGVVRKKVKQ